MGAESADLLVLCGTTAGIAFAHTLLGPDHYLPFAAMARASGWTRTKTSWVTLACGLGHVASSAALGLAAAALGIGATQLTSIESIRGELAAWGLIVFGALYAAWGLRGALRNKPHSHDHVHPSGITHSHEHVHHEGHLHLHAAPARTGAAGRIGLGSLFAIFLLGPCEPLIPLLMYPAVVGEPGQLLAVVGVFTAVTLVTMLATVHLALAGSARLSWLPGRRFAHAIAGGIVCTCGVLIGFAGL
jgi:ABC-type nickel/cobalt efflux system permease component RcnA